MSVHKDTISTEMDVYVTVDILFVGSVNNEKDSGRKKTSTSMFKRLRYIHIDLIYAGIFLRIFYFYLVIRAYPKLIQNKESSLKQWLLKY